MITTKTNERFHKKYGMHLSIRGEPNYIHDLIELSKVSWYKKGPLKPARTSESITLHYLAEGKHGFEADGKNYLMKAGDVLVVQPGETIRDLEAPIRCLFYHFSMRPFKPGSPLFGCTGVEIEKIKKTLSSPSSRHFQTTPGTNQSLEQIFQTTLQESPFLRLELCCLLILFLTQLIKSIGARPENKISPLISHCLKHIDTHLGDPLSVEDLSKIAKLTPTGFHIRFKKEMGTGPKEYILRKKIDEAQKLLTDTTTRASDISYQLSFCSEQHFSRVFKSFTGESPKNYRLRLSKVS